MGGVRLKVDGKPDRYPRPPLWAPPTCPFLYQEESDPAQQFCAAHFFAVRQWGYSPTREAKNYGPYRSLLDEECGARPPTSPICSLPGCADEAGIRANCGRPRVWRAF